MAFIADLFSSDKGSGFQAQGTPLIQGATAEQANQSYGNTQTGLQQQQAFLQALQAQNGIQNQSDVYNQLNQISQGQGPNPAQAMLAQSTGQNVANQAALMAGQRGASANTGLIARQAAQQGAGIQQNAAGQAATLQAQQSLGAIGQMGGIAGQQVQNQGNAANAYSSAALGQQQNVLNSIGQQNNAAVSMQSNLNSTNEAIAGVNAQNQSNLFGGLLGGAGAILGGGAGKAATAIGNGITHKAEGGEIEDPNGPQSFIGKHFKAIKMAKGGKVPLMLSPGEKYLSPKEAEKVADGKESVNHAGKKVPGKATVKGDSLKNDTVAAKGEAGAFVIPRSIMESDNPEKNAAAFVRAHMSRSQKMSKK